MTPPDAAPSAASSGSAEWAGTRAVDHAMTTWGFIGSGNIGSTVARLAIAAGHDVVLSNSRGPETLADLVGELGPHARAATAQEAASAGDIVVVTIPLKAYRDIPVDALAGKVVIDTMNYYPQRDGRSRRSTTARRRAPSCSRRTCRSRTSSRASTTSSSSTCATSPAGGPAGSDEPQRPRHRRRRRRRQGHRASGARRPRLRHPRPRPARRGLAHPARPAGIRHAVRRRREPTGRPAPVGPGATSSRDCAMRAVREV